MKKLIPFILILAGLGYTHGQECYDFAPRALALKNPRVALSTSYLHAQSPLTEGSLYAPLHITLQREFDKRQLQRSKFQLVGKEDGDEENGDVSILVEMGYILAFESVALGMSFLGSRRGGWMPITAAGFDIFMGLAGLPNANIQEKTLNKIGYYIISAGFFGKALYNLKLGEHHSIKTRFWTNFISFNVLVFTGYYLDTL